MDAAYWAEFFGGKSDQQLADYADHYADSRNWPMLTAVQAQLSKRREADRKWAA